MSEGLREKLHSELRLPGVHAYASAKSVHAGEEIGFFVSSDVPYELTISKPCGLDEDIERNVLHRFDEAAPRIQAIYPGSYALIEHGLPANQIWEQFSIEIWVRPWAFGRRQALVGQFDYPRSCGFGLFLDEAGRIEFYLGDGAEHDPARTLSGPILERLAWQHLVATWDGKRVALWRDGIEVAARSTEGVFRAGAAPIRLAAAAVEGEAAQFGDIDIVMPALYARCLTAADVSSRFAERGLRTPSDRFVLACWPMHEQHGERLQDTSGHQRVGKLINNPTWMIIGPAFRPGALGIHGEENPPYDPFCDPSRGHGIRFARDDLYDCSWEQTQRFRIPEDAQPGIYVARLRFTYQNTSCRYDVTFIVKRARNARRAPMLVLCATNTWLAYSTSKFPDTRDLEAVWPRRGAGLKNSHPEAPRFSCYTAHHAGQPGYLVGLRMPWPNASPNALYDPADAHYGQWARLELQLHLWLEERGFSFDVVSDLDLHRDPEMLDLYQTLLISGHSEYWSIPAYDGVDRYLRNGGSVVVLSGNSLWGRVSFNDDYTIMEHRSTRSEGDLVSGTDVPFPGGQHGEQFHGQDWAKGDMLRRAGRSSAHVIGLDTAGWAFATAADFGVYRVEKADHFLFTTPHQVGLTHGATFGHGPQGELPRAIGHEWDLSTKTLKSMVRKVPAGAVLPPEQKRIEVIAKGVRTGPGALDAYFDVFAQQVTPDDWISCEMIYWERPEGGRVFNAGAVAANWVLGVDRHFDALLKNVLHHFGQSPSLPKPEGIG